MTDDLAALLDHLKTGPANVLGWSDGGIEALLLGIRLDTDYQVQMLERDVSRPRASTEETIVVVRPGGEKA